VASTVRTLNVAVGAQGAGRPLGARAETILYVSAVSQGHADVSSGCEEFRSTNADGQDWQSWNETMRFRKSIKLAPGVRMHVGGSAINWCVGPRRATARFGKRRSSVGSGTAGTGVFARETPGSADARATLSPPTTMRAAITADVASDGRLRFRDAEGNPLPYGQITRAKREQADALRALIAEKCVEINDVLESLGQIHTHTPSPHALPSYQAQEFSDAPPSPMRARKVGLVERLLMLLFKSRRERVQGEREAAQGAHDAAMHAWRAKKDEFESQERTRERFIEEDILRDMSAMEAWLQENLSAIEWPRETLVSFEVSANGGQVLIDVEVPAIEGMPTKMAVPPTRGYQLNVKEMSALQVEQLHMRHIHGVGFRIIGEVFADLPRAHEVVFSAYSPRADPTMDQVCDAYLYSVRVERGQWQCINFDDLDALDVVEVLTQFDLRRDMRETGKLGAIEPLPERHARQA
jgi:hypothetical protein